MRRSADRLRQFPKDTIPQGTAWGRLAMAANIEAGRFHAYLDRSFPRTWELQLC